MAISFLRNRQSPATIYTNTIDMATTDEQPVTFVRFSHIPNTNLVTVTVPSSSPPLKYTP
jgi:hypothetical protein